MIVYNIRSDTKPFDFKTRDLKSYSELEKYIEDQCNSKVFFAFKRNFKPIKELVDDIRKMSSRYLYGVYKITKTENDIIKDVEDTSRLTHHYITKAFIYYAFSKDWANPFLIDDINNNVNDYYYVSFGTYNDDTSFDFEWVKNTEAFRKKVGCIDQSYTNIFFARMTKDQLVMFKLKTKGDIFSVYTKEGYLADVEKYIPFFKNPIDK